MIKNDSLNYFLAFLFATFFIYLIPWIELNGGEFVDIYFYMDRIDYLQAGGNEREYAGLAWLFSEPLWKEIIIFIGYAFDDHRSALLGISFLITFFYTFFLLRRVEFYIAIIFLFNPMMVDLFMAQIRIAMAFIFVLIAYDLYERNTNYKIWVVLLLITGFLIHMSMIVFYGIYYLLYKLNEKVEDKKYYLIAIFTALFIALFMKYGSNLILLAIGDRHANYGELIESSSLTYTFAWLIIASIIATFAEFKEPKNRILIAYAITMMFFFFFSTVLNMFALRYISVTMPITIIAISYLPKHFRQGTYLFLFAYNIFLFKYWFQLTVI